MITVMRKHHKWLMIVIAILAIPFVFYFNKSDLSAQRQTDLGRIYERPVTNVEFQRSVRLFSLARMLGMWQLLQDLMMRPMTETDQYVNFTFNRLVIDHEAQALGIRPTSSEVVAFVKTLPAFQGTGGFDLNKYNEFTRTQLPALGFTEAQLEELVSDQIVLNRLKDLLGAGLHVADSESAEYYDQAYGKLQVAVVRFREQDFEKEGRLPTFTLRLRDENGGTVERQYRLNGPIVLRVAPPGEQAKLARPARRKSAKAAKRRKK